MKSSGLRGGWFALSMLLVSAMLGAQADDGEAQADRLYEKAKYAEALATYQSVIEALPEKPAAYVGAGKCLIALNRITDALLLLQKAAKLPDVNAEVFSVLGQACYWNAVQTRDSGGAMQAGYLEFILGDAATNLARAVKMDPKQHIAYFYLGKVQRLQNKPGEAAPALMKAAKLSPRKFKQHIAEAYRDAAECYDQAGDPKGALKAYKAGFRFDPLGISLFETLWSVYGAKKERHADGVAILKALARARPSAALPGYYLGHFYAAMGKKKEAREAFVKVVKTAEGKKYSNVWAMLGEIYYVEDNDEGRAERYCLKALELEAKNEKAYSTVTYMVTRAVQRRDIDRAIDLTQKILKYQPENGKEWGILGGFYHNQRRLKEALKYYAKAMKFAPKDPNPRCGAGKIRNDQRQYEEAEKLFREGLALDPGHIDTLMNLGWLCKTLGKREEAAKQFTKVLEVDPNHRRARMELESVR